MRRREFIVLLAGAAAAWPCSSRATQTSTVRTLALTSAATPLRNIAADGSAAFRVLFEELKRQGLVDGENLNVVTRSAYGRSDGYSEEMVKEVVRLAPDLIFTNTNSLTHLFKNATTTIPIVTVVRDPIEDGIVSSLSSPDANVTGITIDAGIEVWPKRLQILREAVPALARIGFLAPHVSWRRETDGMLRSVDRSSLTLLGPPLQNPITHSEYDRVVGAMRQANAQALLVSAAPQNNVHRQAIVALAEKYRLPAIYPYPAQVRAGGLMGYAVDVIALHRHAAKQIATILKGEPVRNVPFYQPTKFELLLNLKTAKSLGIAFPAALLARADEVIE